MKKEAFTFLETLIVIGIAAFLAGMIVVFVNPAKRFEEARNKQREIHLQTILNAIEQRKIVEKGWPEDEYLGCQALPEETTTTESGELPIFKIIGKKDHPDYYDLYACIVPKYLDNPLFDPLGGSEEDTHYQIWQNPYTKKVTLRYLNEKILVAGPEVYTVVKPPTTLTYDVNPDLVFFDRATVEGEVVDDGGTFVFERGFAWCLGECEPTFFNDYVLVGSGEGYFSYKITGLEPDRRYSFRAWAKNDVGLSWGQTKQFLTDTGKPIVETLPVEHYGGNWAYLCGQIVSPGVENPTRWINWGESEAMPNNLYFGIGGAGKYCDYIENLNVNQTYYFQAGAQNSLGISKGKIEKFVTYVGKPMVIGTVVDPGSITYYSATISGNVKQDGGSVLSQVGACYSTSSPPDPSLDKCSWKEKTTLGTFSIILTDLAPGTLHYARACAKNTAGLVGCDIEYITFTTDKAPQNPPAWVNLSDLTYGQDGFGEWAKVTTAKEYRLDLLVNNILRATTTVTATSSYISSQYYQAGDTVQIRVRAEESQTHYPSDYTYSTPKTVAKANQEAPLWINLQDPLRYGQDGYLEWASVDTAQKYDVEIYKNNLLATTTQTTITSYYIPASLLAVNDVIKAKVRAAESPNYNPGPYITSAERIVQKGIQNIEITNVIWQSLNYEVEATVKANQAQEAIQYYRIRLQESGASWSEWQTSTIFSGLAPVRTYEFQSKVDETINYEAATSSIYLSTSPKAHQTISNIINVNFTIRICNIDGLVLQETQDADDYRIKLTTSPNWGGWQTSNQFLGLKGNTSYDFQARKRETPLYYEALSNVYTITTPKANQALPGITVYDITWNQATVDGGGGTKVSLDQTNWFNSPHTFTGLNYNTKYSAYAFYPETSTHNPSPIASTTFTTLPVPPPTNLYAWPVNYERIDLDWDDSPLAGDPQFKYYTIYRSLTTGGPYNSIATTTASQYSDTGLQLNTPYYYVVTVTVGTYESGYSNEATATIPSVEVRVEIKTQ